MHLSLLVEMIESGMTDRVLLGGHDDPVTGGRLADLARRGGSALLGRHRHLVHVGENHPLLPVALLSASCAGIPFVPVNYRLDDRRLNELVARAEDALVLVDTPEAVDRIDGHDVQVFDHWLGTLHVVEPQDAGGDEDDVAVVLFTSGTTAEPKSALLRHRHLMAYLLGAVEFASASPDEAALVTVPPYHIAGVANMLSNLFAGRRLVYLDSFDPERWLDTVGRERITQAMVVPTMLSRIVDRLDETATDVTSLRTLSYGGAKVAEAVLRRALTAMPDVGFVNAYGLTETASTIAVLGPDDHRAALTSDREEVRRRLSSAGRVLPMLELEIRDDDARALPEGEVGLIFVRGDQVAGEYSVGSVLDADGWFCTRDRGWVDADGYLFIEGRADDTIIRGGENIAPAEVEEVLVTHPAVREACVVGIPDDEWGQRIAAAVVLRPEGIVSVEALQDLVRGSLRGSKTPDRIVFVESLPHTDTGKVLRRVVQASFAEPL